MIEVGTTSISTEVDTEVVITTDLPEVVVDVSKAITAEVSPDTYVLVSDGMFSGNATGGIPNWLLNAIQQELTVGDGNLMSVLDAMQVALDAVQLGVNQTITQVENLALSQSTLATTLGSQIDGNSAAILDVAATRVTEAGALAVANTAIGTTFGGNVNAYINNLASVYTAPGSATATNISTLQASYNDQTARIDTMEYVTTDEFGYSLGASKLATAPDGSITGWQFTNGTGVQSEFKIQAEKFSVSDGTTGYTPFSISGNNILFNGKVSFTNVTGTDSVLTTGEAASDINANTTTIDGGKITTGSIAAVQIAANTITSSQLTTGIALINGEVKSSDFTTIGGAGFRLKSNAAGTSADPTIYGAYILGGTLDGATLTGQLLDISNMKVANGGVNTSAFSIVLQSISSYVTFYGKNYSSGYLYNRCLLSSQNILINASCDATASSGDAFGESSTSITLQRSIDGGAWVNIDNAQLSCSVNGLGVNMSISQDLFISYVDIIDSTTFSTISYQCVGVSSYKIICSSTNI